MAEYTVTTANGIDFGATGTAGILQNVRTILSTIAFSCPMERDFSWSPPLDEPMAVQMAKMTSRIISAVKQYEPRAEVLQVTFAEEPENGTLIPTVRINVQEV